MPELERVRNLYPDVASAPAYARERARLALAARIDRRSRRPRSRLLLPGAGLAAATAAAAAIALVGIGDQAAIDARAAAILRDAAAKARMHDTPGRGPVLYVKSVNAYLSTYAEAGFSVLVPDVREIWLGPHGGLLDTTPGTPRFLSAADRRRWVAAGRPALSGPDEPPARLESVGSSDLPDHPDALFAQLEDEARGHSEGTYRQMFTLVGDAFRETNLSRAQRAALYEVAARIPGVEHLGWTRDPAGRRGIAVAMEHPSDGLRETLVVDPDTGTLLAEQDVTLAKNFYGYPAGTVVGHSTYLDTRNVAAVGVRPR